MAGDFATSVGLSAGSALIDFAEAFEHTQFPYLSPSTTCQSLHASVPEEPSPKPLLSSWPFSGCSSQTTCSCLMGLGTFWPYEGSASMFCVQSIPATPDSGMRSSHLSRLKSWQQPRLNSADAGHLSHLCHSEPSDA